MSQQNSNGSKIERTPFALKNEYHFHYNNTKPHSARLT